MKLTKGRGEEGEKGLAKDIRNKCVETQGRLAEERERDLKEG